MGLSRAFDSEEQLEDVLSTPSDHTREIISGLDGDVVVLGAGGKMGPTLCLLLKKAAPDKTVFAVSRFSDPAVKDRLEDAGVKTIAADLTARSSFPALPKAPNLYYMVGMKFGATANQPLTWVMNVHVPSLVCENFATSRIVALSTGNIYPLVEVSSGGATEDTPPGPLGEYAQSCLGRERIFQYFSEENNTEVVLVRLSYANEPRYGVIVDIVRDILAGKSIDVTMGHVNLIWQGDANDYIARAISLAACPAEALNVTGPEVISIRYLATRIAVILGREVTFVGREEPTALLENAGRCFEMFGYPRVTLGEMIHTIANWVASGKRLLDKPTKFQVRNGKF